MQKRLAVLAVLVVAVLALAGALHAGAQVADIVPVPYEPSMCSAPRYDLNGDGTLNKKDVLYFEQQAARCLDPFGQAIPGVVCDPELDVNRDGKVDRYDLDHLYRYIVTCLYPPRPNTGGQPIKPVDPGPVEP